MIASERRITIRLNRELAREVKAIAKKKDLDLSKLARRAFRFYLRAGCPEMDLAGLMLPDGPAK